ncbi:sporulation protein [Desulforamulus hydrothermalis]|uniref:SpoOM family protein n=1 Tax=Desulforamulus hydrothermalis Lam5 = DSM 18033 TaxID=1121428 RepID=K8E747_9FIRM|nr:sporulation protein [Desulforamulus hydrothermalis]CCO07303.1 SpoOM family protein [Desulforamulus hydrothermalis Lam5 = DSM 18033]SHG93599.1 sporulation-control protein [Desulforamulus hydrothermalis Lam5 = DSM 18033]
MFKKLMASLGVGAARVNLVLDYEQCRIGEQLTGKVMVEGGSVDQAVHTLDVDIIMKFTFKGKEVSRRVDTIQVARDFCIKARESRAIPFGHTIPFNYPVTKGSVSYSLVTRMDIAQAVDAEDADKLVVLPSREMSLVLNSLEAMGFKDKVGSGKIDKLGQQFAFYPSTLFSEQLQELQLYFYVENNGLKIYWQFKLSGGYMRSGLEHYAELTLPAELLAGSLQQEMVDHLKKFLEHELHRISVQGPRIAPSYQNVPQHLLGAGRSGFMGGLLAGMLGGALLGNLLDDEEAEAMGEAEAADGFAFDLDGFLDFGDDEF